MLIKIKNVFKALLILTIIMAIMSCKSNDSPYTSTQIEGETEALVKMKMSRIL